MAKEDVTARAVRRAVARLSGALERVSAQIPLGPDKVEMTPDEVLKRYEKMSPEERVAFASTVGDIDTTVEMLNDARAQNT